MGRSRHLRPALPAVGLRKFGPFAAACMLFWGSGPTPVHARDRPLQRIGPLNVDAAGRDRVRGNRGEQAPIHGAWLAPAKNADDEHRRALAAFERGAFPPGAPTTIVKEPPEPWMAKLTVPAIPVRWNGKTVEYLRFFRDTDRGRGMIRAWFRRLGRYESTLRPLLRKAGVPEDLLFVALAESGFNPAVRSRVGAGGMWQFMESTGRVYGLQQDFWVDDRFDVEKSTFAAALYLKDLHTRFGTWELALAAYNAGYGLVMTAIKRHNTNNFWALAEIESGLPYATGNYPPKIVAAAIVGRNRAAFGCDAKSLEILDAVDYVEVRVPRSTPLALLAEVSGTDEDLLEELNASLRRKRTPPRPDGYSIRIPRTRVDAFKAGRDQLAAHWAKESTVRVREGESLARIAKRHGIREKALRKLNGIEDSAEVVGGTTLVVPKQKPKKSRSRGSKSKKKRGAKQSKRGERPLAAVPPVDPGPNRRLVFFETTRATTPSSIARSFGISWDEIIGWNDLDPLARLQGGQWLQIVVDASFDPIAAGIQALERDEVELVVRGSRAHLEGQLRRRGMVRRGYKIRRGDGLKKIAKRFGLTVGDLARINGFSRRHDPKRGETIVVYVPRGRTGSTVRAPDPEPNTQTLVATRPPPRSPSSAVSSRIPGRQGWTDPAAPGRAAEVESARSSPRPTALPTPPGPGPKQTPKPAPEGRQSKPRRAPSTPTTSRVPGRRTPR